MNSYTVYLLMAKIPHFISVFLSLKKHIATMKNVS